MTNLKQGGDGNFIVNHTYVPKDKATFIVTDDGIEMKGYYPVFSAKGIYSDFTLDGVVCESNQEFIDWIQANCFKKKVAFDVYFKGVADESTDPVMEGGVMYIVLAPSTLPNFKDSEGDAITVTQDDLNAGDVYLIGTDGVFDMQVDATRDYVDAKVAGINMIKVANNSGISDIYSSTLLGFDGAKKQALIYFSAIYTGGSTIIQRRSNGTADVGNPIDPPNIANMNYVDNATKNKPEIQALTAIADPSTATVEDCATLLNSIVAALKA